MNEIKVIQTILRKKDGSVKTTIKTKKPKIKRAIGILDEEKLKHRIEKKRQSLNKLIKLYNLNSKVKLRKIPEYFRNSN